MGKPNIQKILRNAFSAAHTVSPQRICVIGDQGLRTFIVCSKSGNYIHRERDVSKKIGRDELIALIDQSIADGETIDWGPHYVEETA